MLKGKIKIVGTKPLVFHRFNIEVITSLTKVKTGSAGNNPEEWKSSFFHDKNKLYVPDVYMFACLKNAAVHTKAGRGSIQKTWISGVQINPSKLYLNREMFDNWEKLEATDLINHMDANAPVYVDVRMVSNPNTKGKNVRYRVACSPGWELSFEISVDDTLISKNQALKVIEDGGKLQGVADLRTLGYGRYDVKEADFVKES